MTVNAALKTYLETRRSVPAFQMSEPGPSRAEIEDMIKRARRVPDHGKLAPWRFVAYAGTERERISLELAKVAMSNKPDMDDEMIAVEKSRLTRAPVVIAVISRAAPHVKIPEWEQVLSSGAVCQNLLIAAGAMGFGAQWLTEWYAYDKPKKAALGLLPGERVAGFIYVGTPQVDAAERPRKAPRMSRWEG